jgi:hypothetical protein
MAKKKKTRQSEYAKNKIDEIQQRHKYFAHLKELCNTLHPGLYPILTSKQRELLYQVRGAYIQVVPDGKVPKKITEYINEYTLMVQKYTVIPLTKEHDISIMEYNRYIYPLECIIHIDRTRERKIGLEVNPFEGVPWFEDFLNSFDKRYGDYHYHITSMLAMISNFASDLRYCLYYTCFDKENEKTPKPRDSKTRRYVRVFPHRPERARITLDSGETRSGIRVTTIFSSLSNEDPLPVDKRFPIMSLPIERLGMRGKDTQRLRPVYVTEHAINRIDERTGCPHPGYMQMFLWQSLDHCVARDFVNGRKLVDYIAFGEKIGYLVVSVQRDSILIHTFFLLTANNTPEGNKLRELFGIQKADSQYLGIDKLSTFIHSNIQQHEDVCEWFREAGCESILRVGEYLREHELWQVDGEEIRLAERMREYLKTNDPENVWNFTGEVQTGDLQEDSRSDEQEQIVD